MSIWKAISLLVIIAVTKRYTANRNATQSIENVADLHIRPYATHIDDGVHSQRVAIAIDAVYARDPRRVRILPNPIAVVDEEMMHPEDGIAGARTYVAHDGTDAIMAIGVRTRYCPLVHMLVLSPRVSNGRGRSTYPPSLQLSISEYEVRELHVLTNPELH